MTALWFILAGMTAAAVLGLLWPLSRRAPVRAGEGAQAAAATESAFYEDQIAEIARDLERGLIAPEEAEAARAEAARRLLRASREAGEEARPGEEAAPAEPRLRRRRAASAFALSTIPLVALIAYGLYGSPELPAQTEADREAARGGADDLKKAVGQIEARLARTPDDARGWAVLAPVYMRTGRYDDAARAYARLAQLKGETAETLADWGEALTAAAEGTVPPQARDLFRRALDKDPNAPKPRFYLARAAEQDGDVGEAVRQLTAVEAAAPPGAPWLGAVRETLARLRGEAPPADGPAAPAAKPLAKPPTKPPALSPEQQAAIRGMVDGLDARLQAGGGTPEEWLRLLRSRAVLGEPERASAVLARARAALAGDPRGLAEVEAAARDLGIAPDGTAPPEKPPAAPVPDARAVPDAQAVPDARADPEAGMAAVRALPQADREAAIRGMVESLDRRLAAKGGSVDEWLRLVRSYSVLGERERAAGALDRARMALGASPEAVGRLDGLARELDLPVPAAKGRP